jgi:fructosamine-3-kinase
MDGAPWRLTMAHPLLNADVVRAVERAASAHRGSPWTATGFAPLDARAAHPAGIYRGEPFSVFAKLATGLDGHHQFTAELRGLELIRQRSAARTPVPLKVGALRVGKVTLLLTEALHERPAGRRSRADYEALGHALAALHAVRDGRFGLAGSDGYFGPFRQDNRPVQAGTWAAFYAERRLAPAVRMAADSAHLPAEMAVGIDQIMARLPELAGPEPEPTLLHGDAQQNNFISTDEGAVVIDACPYFGHPELDLALLGYFEPVPAVVFDSYREVRLLDRDFEDRIELWRLFAYLAVITAAGDSRLGREFFGRVTSAVARYR